MRKLSILLVFLVSLTSCTWWKTRGEQTLIDCAKQQGVLSQLTGDGVSLLLAVIGVLGGQGQLDWKAELDSLASQFGPDAIACAVQIAGTLFPPPAAPPDAGTAPSTGDEEPPFGDVVSKHAAEMMRERGWHFKH